MLKDNKSRVFFCVLYTIIRENMMSNRSLCNRIIKMYKKAEEWVIFVMERQQNQMYIVTVERQIRNEILNKLLNHTVIVL